MDQKILASKKHIFWDFDGVIKESVEIKSTAYEELFLRWGKRVSFKVRDHHKLNGGMSRFDKIPLYLSWTTEDANKISIEKLCNDFSKLVKSKVIGSSWVPGVIDLIDYLYSNNRVSYLVTATPQDEIEDILCELQITHFFKEIIGSPKNKSIAIGEIIDMHKIVKHDAVMIGDSETDFIAAQDNNIDFILRKTNENNELQLNINCKMVNNFL